MNNNEKAVKEIPVKLILTVLLLVAAVFFFAFLAKVVVLGKEDLFDTKAFNFFSHYTTPAVIQAMEVISFFGSVNFLFPAYVLLVLWLWFKKEKRLATDIVIVGLSSDLLKLGLKNSFQRQRPDLPLLESLKTYSFPSGHALSSFIFCSILIYMLWKQDISLAWKWVLSVLLILFSITIGISRIVLRYHYASDVLAGFCIAFSWVIFTLWLMNKIHFYMQQRQ